MEQIVRRLKEITSPLYLVHDRAVEAWADRLCAEVQFDGVLSLDVSEEAKTVETVSDICRTLLALGAGRNAALVAMGGGITTDMAAFAASVYKRGIRCILVPTTLLAMVDAAHGGKTGVNLDGYKNMIGTFVPGMETLVDTCFLETLPRRELLCGAAEMLKTFIIADKELYRQAVALFSAPQADTAKLQALTEAAYKIKLSIVQRDPFEKGERRCLNLGHTLAHAIEWYEHSHGVPAPLNHGEAVAVGIVYAATLSEERGIAPKGLAARLEADFKSCGLPTAVPYPMAVLQDALAKDKKNTGPEPRWVLIREIGDVVI